MADQEVEWKKAEAVALWMAGKTGDEIAAALGVTRNQVMGYLHRQGMLGDYKAALQRRNQKVKPAPKKKRAPAPAKPKARPPPPVYIPKEKPPEKECDRADGYCLLDLEKGQCRFVVSDDNVDRDSHLFCGRPCAGREVYCELHKKKVYPRMVNLSSAFNTKQKGQTEHDKNNH